MNGFSIGRMRPRPCSGAKTSRRCQNNVEADNVIIIDVENESLDNVVIIDVPESLPMENQHSSTHHRKDQKPYFNVICIDDDESHDSAGTSSENFLDASTPVRLSKCKRTYSGNASRRNLFGLNGGLETDSSDSDYPDCELVEDSSGEVQERWEKAFSRRKRDFQKSHSESMNKDLSDTEILSHEQSDHSSAPLSNVEKGFVFGNSSLYKGFSGRVLRNRHDEEAKLQEEDISMSNIQQVKDKNGENLPPCEETCIINGRERFKETDEFKRTEEEEWASRNQMLQIQAEEAKNLRRLEKRRKAESLRLLDTERRQKERLEEVRNSQKKDEENMNLKERIRAEVSRELTKLEVSCHSMASLLHLLGISVGSWPKPSPQEVQTAYRRALLTFHPDRTSMSDIRQQVEAEEKCKLINRLKKKYT